MTFWVQAGREAADSSSCPPSVDRSLDDSGLCPWPQPPRHQQPSPPDPRRVCFDLHAAAAHAHAHAHNDAYAHVRHTHASRTPSPRWRNGGSFRTHAGCCSRRLSSSPRRTDLHQGNASARHPKAHSNNNSSHTDRVPARATPWAREWEDEEEQQYRDERDHPWDEPWQAPPPQPPPQPPQQHHPPWPIGPEASGSYARPPAPPSSRTRSAAARHDPAAAFALAPSHDTALMTDTEAAARVAAHLASVTRRCPAARHERILLGLIHPKSAAAAFALDAGALESLFSAANALFFYGRLTRRVRWEWDDDDGTAATGGARRALGHTLLRPARGRGPGGGPAGGFETLIRLSRPLLTDRRYGRRLLLSAFLHELIHCYLFVCCGWRARAGGGHTAGFRAIAHTIDRWAGPANNLHLRHVEADLDRFRQEAEAEAEAAAAEAAAATAGCSTAEAGGTAEPYYAADHQSRRDGWAW